MPLHLLAWKTWKFLCNLPCTELSQGTSAWMEGSERAAPRKTGKPMLQHGQAVAAGARRINAAWLCLCSYAGCWWDVTGLKRGKGIPAALSELLLALCGKMPVLWLKPQQSSGMHRGGWHKSLCTPGHLSMQERLWAGTGQWTNMRQDVSELLILFMKHNLVVGRSFPGGTFRHSWTPYCSSLHA